MCACLALFGITLHRYLSITSEMGNPSMETADGEANSSIAIFVDLAVTQHSLKVGLTSYSKSVAWCLSSPDITCCRILSPCNASISLCQQASTWEEASLGRASSDGSSISEIGGRCDWQKGICKALGRSRTSLVPPTRFPDQLAGFDCRPWPGPLNITTPHALNEAMSNMPQRLCDVAEHA